MLKRQIAAYADPGFGGDLFPLLVAFRGGSYRERINPQRRVYRDCIAPAANLSAKKPFPFFALGSCRMFRAQEIKDFFVSKAPGTLRNAAEILKAAKHGRSIARLPDIRRQSLMKRTPASKTPLKPRRISRSHSRPFVCRPSGYKIGTSRPDKLGRSVAPLHWADGVLLSSRFFI